MTEFSVNCEVLLLQLLTQSHLIIIAHVAHPPQAVVGLASQDLTISAKKHRAPIPLLLGTCQHGPCYNGTSTAASQFKSMRN